MRGLRANRPVAEPKRGSAVGSMARLAALHLVLIAGWLPAASARAQTPDGFFKSRQITFLVGAGAGGGYDAYYRTFARYLVRHIPGAPTIVPKNMPAASGLAAANTLYTSADRDGATIGAFPNNIPMDTLFGNPSALRRQAQLARQHRRRERLPGSQASRPSRRRATRNDRGAAAATSNSAIMPKVLNALLGTKFKIGKF